MFERETNSQITIRSSCHPSAVIVWVGGEKDVSRVCAVGIEAQLASVCVCVFERGVDRLLSRSMCHPTPSVPGSVCVCMFEGDARLYISIKI